MKQKALVYLLALILAACAFAGCASSGGTQAPAAETPAAEGGTDAPAVTEITDPVVFKFHSTTSTEVTGPTMELFLEEIEKNSNGMIQIEAYLIGELYSNDEDQLSGVQSGAIHGTLTGDMCLSWVSPEWISYTSVPFAFNNNEQFLKFFLGEKGAEINGKLQDTFNMMFLDSMIGCRGGRMLTANKAIYHPDDMQGLKFRVPNVIGTVASWEAMGATVIGVPWAELFTSLQNGLVDAEENPFAELDSGGFYQVQSHIMETSHQIGPQLIVINVDFWNSLTPELQQVVSDANKTAMDFFNERTIENDEILRQKFLDNGNTIIPIEEIDIDAFKQVIEEKVLTDEELTKDWAPGGWDYIQSLL